MSIARNLFRNVFFFRPQHENEDELKAYDLGISAEERRKTEAKLKEIEKKFFDLKANLEIMGWLGKCFSKTDQLFKIADDAFSKVELNEKAYKAYHVFLDAMLEAVDQYQSLSKSASTVITTKRNLLQRWMPETGEADLNVRLATKQAEFMNQYGDCAASTSRLTQSSLQLVGKTADFKILRGVGLAIAGTLMIAAAILVFASTSSTAMPLSALVAMIGIDLILSGVGIAMGVTVVAGSLAAVIGGSVYAAKGAQHGLSKKAYEASRVMEKEINILVADLRP